MGQAKVTACYRELGAELRKRRQAAGITLRGVAEYAEWHYTKVSRIESGQFRSSVVDVIFYLGACGIYRAQARDLLDLFRSIRPEDDPGPGIGGRLQQTGHQQGLVADRTGGSRFVEDQRAERLILTPG